MRILLAAAVALLTFAGSAAAQAAGPVNPSTATWTAPTKNADASPLADLNLYNLRCAGPAATAPTYNATVYPVKKQMPSTTQAPLANTLVKFGTDASQNLAGDLGITIDGQYWCFVTAVDLFGNEGDIQRVSGVQAPNPFGRNRVAPDVVPGFVINP